MSMSELESGSATVGGGGEGGCHHTDLIRSCGLGLESGVGRLEWRHSLDVSCLYTVKTKNYFS